MRVLAQRQQLQPYELLTQILAEGIGHLTKQLNCNDSILLVGVVMGHLQHVFEYAFPSIFVVQSVRDDSQMLPSLLLNLGLGLIEKTNQQGHNELLDFVVAPLESVHPLNEIGNLFEKGRLQLLLVFHLRNDMLYDEIEQSFEYGYASLSGLLENYCQVLDVGLSELNILKPFIGFEGTDAAELSQGGGRVVVDEHTCLQLNWSHGKPLLHRHFFNDICWGMLLTCWRSLAGCWSHHWLFSSGRLLGSRGILGNWRGLFLKRRFFFALSFRFHQNKLFKYCAPIQVIHLLSPPTLQRVLDLSGNQLF